MEQTHVGLTAKSTSTGGAASGIEIQYGKKINRSVLKKGKPGG